MREKMFWKKVFEKQRAKRCFGKKSLKNNARKDVLEKSPRKTSFLRRFVFKTPEKMRWKHGFFPKHPL